MITKTITLKINVIMCEEKSLKKCKKKMLASISWDFGAKPHI